MTEYELHDQDYIYRLELTGICKYDKQTKECLRNIPYETISTVELGYVPPSRHGGDYYQCTIYYNEQGKKGYFQQRTLSVTNKDDYPEYYINLVKELHHILAEKKVIVNYKIGESVTTFFHVLIATFLIYSSIMLLNNYGWLITVAVLLYFLFKIIPNLVINFPRAYSHASIPANLLPINLDKKEIDRNIGFGNFSLFMFILPIATFAFVFFLFGEGIYTNILHKNETERSLYNNTNSNIAAVYIENSENILEQNEILKPNQHTEVWVAVDTLKKKGENSTVKLLFTDSISYEFRMPLDSRYNGCNYDICINDDGNH